jgi:hypothetical protein
MRVGYFASRTNRIRCGQPAKGFREGASKALLSFLGKFWNAISPVYSTISFSSKSSLSYQLSRLSTFSIEPERPSRTAELMSTQKRHRSISETLTKTRERKPGYNSESLGPVRRSGRPPQRTIWTLLSIAIPVGVLSHTFSFDSRRMDAESKEIFLMA